MVRQQFDEEHDRQYASLVRAAQALSADALVETFISRIRSPQVASDLRLQSCPSTSAAPIAIGLDAEAARLLRCGRGADAAALLQGLTPSPTWRDGDFARYAGLLAEAGLMPRAREWLASAVAHGEFQKNDDSRRARADVSEVPIEVARHGHLPEAVDLATGLPTSELRAAALDGVLRVALEQSATGPLLAYVIDAADSNGYAMLEPLRTQHVVLRAQALARLGRLREARLSASSLPDTDTRLPGAAGILDEYAWRLNPDDVRRFSVEQSFMSGKAIVGVQVPPPPK